MPSAVRVQLEEVVPGVAAAESTARLATAVPTVVDCVADCWYAMFPPAVYVRQRLKTPENCKRILIRDVQLPNRTDM